jgi:hypothetical protein
MAQRLAAPANNNRLPITMLMRYPARKCQPATRLLRTACRACWASYHTLLALLVVFLAAQGAAAAPGAVVPWTTYEAETMTYSGTLLGPSYAQNTVEGEACDRMCVKLTDTGHYVALRAQQAANAIVVRYSMPDSAAGGGFDATISLYTNGVYVQKLPVTSKYSWLYGAFPWTNSPTAGSPRNFYDELRLAGLRINSNDTIRIQKNADDTAAYYVIDLIDTESVAAPLSQPGGSRSVMSYGAVGNGIADDTAAIRNALVGGGVVWFPSGSYLVSSYIDVPSTATIQGAGMWHTTFVGSPTAYTNANGRVRFSGMGSNIHFVDFAIIGRLTYRNDTESNDGFSERFGTNSSITRVWVEHTKTGAWIANSMGMLIRDCRFRNVIADALNLCVGVRASVVSNCTARGAGDDCFAIWPATYIGATYKPGLNLFTQCTGLAPFAGNGGTIYGGEGNAIDNCLFADVPYGCGVLLSGTFPVGTNVFSGTTLVQHSDLIRCGGDFYLPALKLMVENQAITNVSINNLTIMDSRSHAIGVEREKTAGATLSGIVVSNWGVGVAGCYALWAGASATGVVNVSDSTIGDYANYSSGLPLEFDTIATPLPAPWLNGDIGNGILKGAGSFSSGVFTLVGAGADIEGSADAFRYVCQSDASDCWISAQVVAQQNTDPWAKAGVMIRQDLTVGAPNAAVLITPGNGVRFQWRTTRGGATASSGVAGVTTPRWLRLARNGNSFTAAYSSDGNTWTQIGTSQTVVMPADVTLGLAVTAHNNTLTSTATMVVGVPEPAWVGMLTAVLFVGVPRRAAAARRRGGC